MDQKILEKLTKTAEGRFKLTSLLQKRMKSLLKTRRVAEPAPSGGQLLDRAAQEIDQGKVILLPDTGSRFDALTSGEVKEGKEKPKGKDEE